VADNIALIGFMGVGKSAVGKVLAELLDMRYVDLDEEVERRSGRTVADIIRNEGEDAFRKEEHDALMAMKGVRGHIISCGGGIVLRDDNIRLLRGVAIVVLLTARPEELIKRIETDGGRPLLAGTDDPLARSEQMITERMPRYRRTAHHIVDTSGRDPRQVAAHIMDIVGVSP